MAHQQPRLPKGRRVPTATAVNPEVERLVQETARRFGCSRSWVRNVALAEFFGVDVTRPEDRTGHRLRRRPR